MKVDDETAARNGSVREEDQQNRREFFNGLGKWSMIVVAAASLLRATVDSRASYASSEELERSSLDGRFQRLSHKLIARVRSHEDKVWHTDSTKHQDFPHQDHGDYNYPRQGGGGRPPGQPPKMYEESQ